MENARFICSICLERFVQPRVTKCGHTFCEQCLFTFVLKTQKTSSPSYFECPVCREKVNLPASEVTEQWIKDTFAQDTMMLQNMKTETESIENNTQGECDSETTETAICTPCKEGGNEYLAVKFCLNCCEALCKTCFEWHKKFKLLKQHDVVSINTVNLLQVQSLSDKFERCSKCNKHSDKRYVTYCLNHEEFCCIQCVTKEHRSCEVLNISEIDGMARNKVSCVTEMYQNARKHIELLSKLNEDNTNLLLSNIDKLADNVRSMKERLFASLDRQFSVVMSRLKEIRTIIQEDTGNRETLNKLEAECEKKIDFMKSLESFNSNEHMFILSQTMQKEIKDIEKEIRNVDAALVTTSVSFDICDVLNSLTEKLNRDDSIFSVNLKTTRSEHEPYEAIEDLIQDFRVKKLSELAVDVSYPSPPLFSSISVHDEHFLLLDISSSNVYSYKSSTKQSSKFIVENAFSVLQFDSQNLLVSKPEQFTISHMKLLDGRPSGTLSWKINAKPYTLCKIAKNAFVVATQEPDGFQFLEIIGTKLILQKHLTQDTNGSKIKPTEYFAVDVKRSRLIQSCPEQKEVTCITFDGHTVFQFQSSELECPEGLALDRNGNIFVCNHSYFNPSVLLLSPEGILISEIKEGIPRKPMSICFDRSGKTFWLTSNYIESSFSVHGFEWMKIAKS